MMKEYAFEKTMILINIKYKIKKEIGISYKIIIAIFKIKACAI